MKQLASNWYRRSKWLWLLLPLSALFYVLVILRRIAYRRRVFTATHFKPIVIVVGNITVGGTGKTPLVISLVSLLQSRGLRVGIVSRGYGGKASEWPQFVNSSSSPASVGDEAVMLAVKTGCPVVVAPDRVAAVRMLLNKEDIDCVISDDGLQHYALGRQIEVVLFDGTRGVGNGFLLPAGPLREPLTRIREADFILANGASLPWSDYVVQARLGTVVNAATGEVRQLDSFKNEAVFAVAGIGNPGRFFALLSEHSISIRRMPFPDHHPFCSEDFNFLKSSSTVMLTEKDAVKCCHFMDERFWIVKIEMHLPDNFSQSFLAKVNFLLDKIGT